MKKELLYQQPRILVIEDEKGMKTSYYPGLAWNGLGYSFPIERRDINAVREDQMLFSNLDFSANKARECDARFVDIDRSRKIFSAKNMLRDISRYYEVANKNNFFSSNNLTLENQAYLHSNLMYLIAATDGNEDTVGHSQLVARYTLLLTKALGIEDGDLVEVASRRGTVRAKAKITEKSSEGVTFMTFHFAETPTNVLTNPALDPVAKIPEFKVCAVKLSKAGGE